MSYKRDSGSENAMARSQRIKGVFAGVVIALCVGFLVWALWPSPPVVIPPSEDPAAQWTRGYGAMSAEHASKQDAFYWATSRITTEPTPDNTGIIIKGKVKTPAELALLKAELPKITPAVPLTWDVTVSP
ncbi:MAG TPA: hypothetical protein VEB22_14450 [Phycisphaerales bacterium]|nr:hypothetical protein [Phycisphaerales bacterium]